MQISDDLRGNSVLAMDGIKVERTGRELRIKPVFTDKDRLPLPTKADFAYLEARSLSKAVAAALAISSEWEAKVFMRDVGLKPLITAVVDPIKGAGQGDGARDLKDWCIDAIKVR